MNEKKKLIFLLLVLPFLAALLLPYTIKQWMFDHKLVTIYYILVSSLMSFGLIPLMYKIGMILDITDQPGGRHIQKEVIPRTGGIMVYITFIATLNIVIDSPREFQGLFWASNIIALIGIIDDIKRIPAIIKLIFQVMATTVLVYYGFTFTFLPNTLTGNILEIILTYIWMLGITNAFNFLDGLDGLASGVGIIVLAFFAIIASSVHDTFMMIVSIILLGSILGFLPYNFRIRKKALIFLGDNGSTFIGFTIAAISIYGRWGDYKGVNLVIPILLLAVPITDMTMTTLIRTFRKQVHNIGELLAYTGNDHFHHRLLQLGIKPKPTVIVIYLLTVMMGLLSLLLKQGNLTESLIALGIGVIIFCLIVAFMIHTENEKWLEKK